MFAYFDKGNERHFLFEQMFSFKKKITYTDESF